MIVYVFTYIASSERVYTLEKLDVLSDHCLSRCLLIISSGILIWQI